MYLAGEADWLNGGLPPDQIGAMKSRDDYQSIPALGTYYYLFNLTAPPLDDVNIRKALATAIDKQTLVEGVLHGRPIAADTIVPPLAGYNQPKGNGYNAKTAREHLAKAGYPDGDGFPEITVLYNTSEIHKKIAEYIQQQWENHLGITVMIENAEWKTLLACGSQQDFQVIRMGWIGDYLDPNTFLELFQTDYPQNFGKYSNPQFDTLIRKAARMQAGEARLNTLEQAEKLLINQDQALIPLNYFPNINMIDLDEWGGWYSCVLDWHHPKFIFKKQ